MGLLDDAIREHLELKRRHGADPAEIERLEQEALGPVQHRGEYAPAPVDITPHAAFADEELEAEPAGGGAGAYAYDEYETRVHEAAAEPAEDDEEWEYYDEDEEEPPAGADSHAPPAAGAYAAPAPGEAYDEDDYEEPPPARSDLPAAARDDEPPAYEPEAPAQGAYGGAAAEPGYRDEALTEIFGPGEAATPAREQPPADEQPTQVFSLPDEPPPRADLWAGRDPAEPEPPQAAADAPDQGTAAFSAQDVADATGRDAARASEPPPPGEEDVLEETPDFLQETPEHDRLWFEQRPPRGFDFDQ